MEAPLALYRRYRPETFAEVIGQDHVTAPLRNALSNNRVNHAYLFSGPRGCGKTTSARILARAINCEKGPIAEPCGVCKSCTDLARGGPGSIDVIEIDAASHGGVDDARDLRERAFFAPVESRYKIYIIDEAHMVTTQGFNALLKLVEEPPPHLKFIFATTEPDKVIGTIRSRTHHYPFRLVPPKALADYMATLCESEGVAIEPAALPLVVRAGAGSVRDSLSVLDQLIGGAGPDGVTYALAVALLGFTPDSLLDACVDGFAAHDSAAVFETIEKVIETGQDPKRFAEDLLRRLRDLVVLSAVPTAVTSGLIEAAEDQGERLQTQASGIGPAELTRAADIVAAGLLEMRGATAPRLQLELICAKVLLPGADDSTNGIQARLDRMERRLAIGATPEAAPGTPGHAPPGAATPGQSGAAGTPGHAQPGASTPGQTGAAGTPGYGQPGAGTPGQAGAAGAPGYAAAPDAPGAGPAADAATSRAAARAAATANTRPAPTSTSPGAAATPARDEQATSASPAEEQTGPASASDAPAGGASAAGASAGDTSALGAPAGDVSGGGASAGGVGASGVGGAVGLRPGAGADQTAGSQGVGASSATGGAEAGSDGSAGSASGGGVGVTGGGAGGRTGAWGDETAVPSAPSVPAQSAPSAAQEQPAQEGSGGAGAVGLADIRRLWPEVLEAVKAKRRFAWIMLSQNAQVIAIDAQTLTLGLVNAGARESFARSGSDEILRQAMIDTIGINRRVEAVVDPSTDPGAGGGAAPNRPGPQPGNPGPQPGGPGPHPGAPGPQPGGPGPQLGGPGPQSGGHGGPSGQSGLGGPDSQGGPGPGSRPEGPGAGGPAASGPAASGAAGSGAAESGAGAGGARAGGAGAGGPAAGGTGAGGAGVGGSAAGLDADVHRAASGVGGLGAGGAAAGGPGGDAYGAGGTGAGAGVADGAGAGTGLGAEAAAGRTGASWDRASGDGARVAVALEEPPDSEYDIPPEDPWADGPAGGPNSVAESGGGTSRRAARQTAQQGRQGAQSSAQSPAQSSAQSGGQGSVGGSKWRAAEAAVAAEQARQAAAAASAAPEVPLTPEEEADAIGEDDQVLEDDSRSHTDLLIETLGAQIITEEPN